MDCSRSYDRTEEEIDRLIAEELDGIKRPSPLEARKTLANLPVNPAAGYGLTAPVAAPETACEGSMLAIRASILPKGYATIGAKEIALEWPIGPDPDLDAVDTLIDQLGPWPAITKEIAPCLIPAIFKAGKEDNRTKSGRNRTSDAEAGTLLVFDVDRGNLGADQIRSVIEKTGLSGIFWSTWQSGGSKGNRWRLLFPLETPVIARMAYPEIWKRLARALEALLAEELGVESAWAVVDQDERWKHGIIDHLPSPVHKHILPCFPSEGRGSEAYPWGGIKPKPEFLPGVAVPVDLDRLKAQGLGERTSRSRPRDQKSKFGSVPKIEPYKANPDAGHVEDTIHNLIPFTARVPGPLAALDAVSRLRRDGIEVGPGTRHDTLVGAVWHLFRLGSTIEEMENAANEMVNNTTDKKDRKYLESREVEVVSRWSREAAQAESLVTTMHVATRDQISKFHREVYRRYLRILARHQHLSSEKGGKLDHAAIARILGLDVTAIVKMRSILAEAGFLTMTGEGLDRRYQLVTKGV